MLRELINKLRRFRYETEGAMSVEAVLILPVLVWWYVASFVVYDGFRAYTRATKVGYTLGDILSRQTEVDNDYIDGLHQLADFLTTSTDGMWIRVTTIIFENDEYEVVWSYGTNGTSGLTDADISSMNIDDRYLPVMVDGETVILTETAIPYVAPFNVGVADQTYSTVLVTRPRFTSQLANHDF